MNDKCYKTYLSQITFKIKRRNKTVINLAKNRGGIKSLSRSILNLFI